MEIKVRKEGEEKGMRMGGGEGVGLGSLLTRCQIIVFHNCLSMFYDAGTVNLGGREGGREGGRLISDTSHACYYGDPHPINVPGASLGSEHAKYPGATPNIQNNLSSEQVLVMVDGIPIGQSAHLVLQHLLMNAYTINAWVLNIQMQTSGWMRGDS